MLQPGTAQMAKEIGDDYISEAVDTVCKVIAEEVDDSDLRYVEERIKVSLKSVLTISLDSAIDELAEELCAELKEG